MVDDTRPVMRKDLAISVEKTFHQHSRHECDEHEVHVCVERANPWAKGFVVQPGRRLVDRLEEIAQNPRRLAQSLILLLDAGPDEVVQDGGRQRGEFLHDRVEHGVADGGVLDVVVGRGLVAEAGLRITLGLR